MSTPYTEQIAEKERELAIATAGMRPIQQRVNRVEQELRKLRSLEWIQANGVTKENVEWSVGDDKPYFGILHDFTKWLKANSTKPFSEWNGRLYRTRELLDGSAYLSGPGRTEDLE